MANFMFVYRTGVEALSGEPSPEEMQQVMAQWGQWYEKIGDSVVDGGDGLKPDGKQIAADGTVTDGPFIEAKELVGGFTIVRADDIDSACKLAEGCPVLASGGRVEVRPCCGFNDQP